MLAYSWRAGRECALSIGPEDGRPLLFVAPLFEEANRCRRLIVETMRALSDQGFRCILPDLPGTGDSLTAIADTRLIDWRDALAAAAAAFRPQLVASFRGGALIDDASLCGALWRFSPETGARLVRDLKRAQWVSPSGEAALYAGHALSQAMLADLEAAIPAPHPRIRTVRLSTDALEADANVEGAPLWRRAEPGEDAAQSRALAQDLAHWAEQCVAR